MGVVEGRMIEDDTVGIRTTVGEVPWAAAQPHLEGKAAMGEERTQACSHAWIGDFMSKRGFKGGWA